MGHQTACQHVPRLHAPVSLLVRLACRQMGLFFTEPLLPPWGMQNAWPRSNTGNNAHQIKGMIGKLKTAEEEAGLVSRPAHQVSAPLSPSFQG